MSTDGASENEQPENLLQLLGLRPIATGVHYESEDDSVYTSGTGLTSPRTAKSIGTNASTIAAPETVDEAEIEPDFAAPETEEEVTGEVGLERALSTPPTKGKSSPIPESNPSNYELAGALSTPNTYGSSFDDFSFDDSSEGAIAPKPKFMPLNRRYLVISLICLILNAIAVGTGLYFGLFRNGSNSSARSSAQQVGTFGADGVGPNAELPSLAPTEQPTHSPTAGPTPLPTERPTPPPTRLPTNRPVAAVALTTAPTPSPTTAPTFQGTPDPYEFRTIFCVIADVPYSDKEEPELKSQLKRLSERCEFVVHLGDIWKGSSDCTRSEFKNVDKLLKRSPKPMFMVIGDNEWNDCTDTKPDKALEYWHEYFDSYDTKHWNHTFAVGRQADRVENFHFVHKRTLFIGLNLVGGEVLSNSKWKARLRSNLNWTETLIQANVPSKASGVVLMGHCKVEDDENYKYFFKGFRDYIDDVMDNQYPVLYIHGDGHEWIYTKKFLGQRSWLRIEHMGGTTEKPLVMRVDTHTSENDVTKAFKYERRDDRRK